ncbi:hypothetical protein [Bradyrhizobium valentinum]|uniref:Protein kinase domain-containing protein n=1 Tax=Bradyrhizobium valentinum TaxID=1518501 RepID=A0A0R3M315_9BRAD|nr:hypothetical protein [Bradyrhizobium valentinum]KRR11584.1 hypothetical protein CP49_18320 [Bradyrhizobium valentinum]
MLKPYNRAELHFEFIREIGGDGRNSRTFVSQDHQLNAEIVIKQIDKTKLPSAVNFFDESMEMAACVREADIRQIKFLVRFCRVNRLYD